MLSAGHLAFPLAAGASVASDSIVKSTTPTHRAVTQHHHMSIVGFHAIQKPCRSQINSVPNHDDAAQSRASSQAGCQGPRTRDCASFGRFTSQQKPDGANRRARFSAFALWAKRAALVWIRSPVPTHAICARKLAAIVDNSRSNNSVVSKAIVEQIDSNRRHVAASVGRIFIRESVAVVCQRSVFT